MAERKTNPASDISSDRESRFLLVVDSDANNLFYTSMLLQRFDYQIRMATTAKEALQMATDAAPSLIITSLGIKDMNGLEFMRQLKQNPRCAGIPFIALMKHGDLLGERRCFEHGAVDCLDQPVSPERLYRAVQAAVEATPRASIRIRTHLPVKVNDMPLLDDGEGAYASVLSEGGMFLRTRSPVVVDTRLSLRIDLNGRIIPVEAVVLYGNRTDGGPYHEPGMGLEFVRIAPKDQELIRQFIRSEVTRGIAPLND